MNRDNSQIIAFDTPGLVTSKEVKKHRLDPDFIKSCRHSIQCSNLVGVVHDVSNHWTRHEINPMILDLLEEFKTRSSFLILNKVDKLKSKRVLLDLIARLTCDNISLKPKLKSKKFDDEFVKNLPKSEEGKRVGFDNFRAVYMVSALNGDGIEDILSYIESQAQEQPWEFKNNELTDQKPVTVIEEFVRARLLDFLPQEMPYTLNSELEYFSDENNKIFASVIVKCPSERIERFVCGGLDGKLRQITDRITSDLVQHFQKPVTLTINTVVIKSNKK
jgi:GTPase